MKVKDGFSIQDQNWIAHRDTSVWLVNSGNKIISCSSDLQMWLLNRSEHHTGVGVVHRVDTDGHCVGPPPGSATRAPLKMWPAKKGGNFDRKSVWCLDSASHPHNMESASLRAAPTHPLPKFTHWTGDAAAITISLVLPLTARALYLLYHFF